MTQVGGGRLRELDGWRAVSVLLVIFHHLGSYQHAGMLFHHHHLALVFRHFGPLGVDVFFVISGFVICRLLILEEERYGKVSLKAFYVRRAFRILPPFYLYIACLFFLLATGLIHETYKGITTGALFLYDIVPAKVGGWFIGHTWSLAVEEQFYLTFPAVLVLTRMIERKRIFLAIFCLLGVWNYLAAVFGWNYVTNPSTRSGFACICCGVLVAFFEAEARAIARTLPALAVAGVALSLLWHPDDYLSWLSALYDSLYTPLAIAALLIFSLERDTRLRTLLCLKPVQAIGLTSYSIYLWQELFTAPKGPEGDYTLSGNIIAALLPLLFVVIPFSWFLIEKPAMKLGRLFSDRIRRRYEREVMA